MVCTTLNFAEKYLLKTEVRSVAGMYRRYFRCWY